MSKIGKNIRKIRATKGLSQTGFANLFNLTRASIGAYEEGRAEPKTDTTLLIAKHFSIPVEALLAEELTVNRLTNFTLESALKPQGKVNQKSILFINKWSWNSFINNDIVNEEFTVQFPDGFLLGEIAIEVSNQIETNLPIGTILICSPIKTPTKSGLYLIFIDNKVSTLDFSSVSLIAHSAKKLFIINQKIDPVIHMDNSDFETRLTKIESDLSILTKKIS
jgi:DNA-binding XRE family transcriptional regulator